MAFGRRILLCIFNKNQEGERNFLENGSIFLKDLITFSNGKYNMPIHRFSIKELSQATNGFCSNQIVVDGCDYKIYKGSFDKCLILIKKANGLNLFYMKSQAIRDMVIMALMSSHKNVFKLIGCCLDFEIPASVYEYAGGSIELISKRLYESEGGMAENGGSSLAWKSRLKIANDIAYAVIYMHTAFSTPIIHRDLKPSNIIIDQYGVAKLLDFSLSISIPPGETQVEEQVAGTYGFIDPTYMITGFLSEKSDVYGFGMILLELLTGKRKAYSESHQQLLKACVKDYVDNDKFNEVVDPTILKERGGIEQEQQLQAVLVLALRCTKRNREDRPEMIEVAKEIRRILKSDCPSSSTQP